MSLLATGGILLFVGVFTIAIGILDYSFPDAQSANWYMNFFEHKVQGHEILYFIGGLLVCISLCVFTIRFIKKMKKKHRKHHSKKHAHRTHREDDAHRTHSGHHTHHHHHRPRMHPSLAVLKKKCASCGAVLAVNSKFCNLCGTQIPSEDENDSDSDEANAFTKPEKETV